MDNVKLTNRGRLVIAWCTTLGFITLLGLAGWIEAM